MKKDWITRFNWIEWLFIIFLTGITYGIMTYLLEEKFGINKPSWLMLICFTCVYGIYAGYKHKHQKPN